MKQKADLKTLEIAKKLYYEGKFYREISVETGLCLSVIQRYSSSLGWQRNPDYKRNQRIIRKKPKSTIEKVVIRIKNEPIIDEHCMITSCRRLMWAIENDRSL